MVSLHTTLVLSALHVMWSCTCSTLFQAGSHSQSNELNAARGGMRKRAELQRSSLTEPDTKFTKNVFDRFDYSLCGHKP